MKHIKIVVGVPAIIAASAFTLIQSLNWNLNGDYSVKSGVCVFRGLKATISFDETNPEKSKIAASIDATSISTGNRLMDEHAKDKEALYTAKYPVITFVSTAVKRISPSRYEAIGKLTLKGITKEIKLPFTFDSKKNVMDRFPMVTKETFSGRITIAAKDFNITREGVPEEVFVDLTIPVSK